MKDMWFLCRFRRGETETTGWIEARGAKVGASVELKTDGFSDAPWTVVNVCAPGLDAAALAQKQAKDRNSLASIRGN